MSWDTAFAADSVEAEVPNLAPGLIGVRVETGEGEDLQRSNYLNFEVTKDYAGPRVLGFDPPEGPVGQYVQVVGTGFGSSLGVLEFVPDVGIDAEGDFDFPPECGTSYWSDTQIIVKVPKKDSLGGALGLGDYKIRINGEDTSTSDGYFTVNADSLSPGICAVNPVSGPKDTEVDLYGEYFMGVDEVTFHNGVIASFTEPVTDDQLIEDAIVPEGAISGPIHAYIGGLSGLESNGYDFLVQSCFDTGITCPALTGCCPDGSCSVDCLEVPPDSVYHFSFTSGLGIPEYECSTEELECKQDIGLCTGEREYCSEDCMCEEAPPCDSTPKDGVCEDDDPSDTLCDFGEVCDTDCYCQPISCDGSDQPGCQIADCPEGLYCDPLENCTCQPLEEPVPPDSVYHFSFTTGLGAPEYECSTEKWQCVQDVDLCTGEREYCDENCMCEEAPPCDSTPKDGVCQDDDPDDKLCDFGEFCDTDCYCKSIPCDDDTVRPGCQIAHNCPEEYFCDPAQDCTCQPLTEPVPPDSVYAWGFSTGYMPRYPEVIEDCYRSHICSLDSELPSPTPWSGDLDRLETGAGWDDRGGQACVNSIINYIYRIFSQNSTF